jgi:hypothetical protein
MSEKVFQPKCTETRYGFIYNNAHVERVASDNKWGSILYVASEKYSVEIRVTPGGKIVISEIIKNKKVHP